jgi:hypothetical protein
MEIDVAKEYQLMIIQDLKEYIYNSDLGPKF